MENFAIRVSSLSKEYFLSRDKFGLSFTDRINNLFKLKKTNKTFESFYALKDINFEIKKGDTVGIIGRNGAGKSTLLKILSEVISPTRGKIEINGTVASVLEVGMGFHPDLTGRENIYLSGTLYGLSKSQIDKSFDKIVEFSGVERFIDTPVKHYSSGMYIRLAFTIITHIDADIFLFDEVLAVGDLAFQLKCREMILQLAASNKTVLIVSHNHFNIIELCSSVIYLESGRIIEYGETSIVKKYFEESLICDPPINVVENGQREKPENIESKENKVEKDEKPEKTTEDKVTDIRGKDTEDNEENNVIVTRQTPVFKNLLRKEWPHIEKAPGNDDIKIKKVYILNESRPGCEHMYTCDKLSLNIEYEKFNDNDFYDICFAVAFMNLPLFAFITTESDVDMKSFVKSGMYTAKVIINEYFFNDVIITISSSIFKNNDQLIWYDIDVLHFKIDKDISEHGEAHSKITDRFTFPLLPKMKWDVSHNN